MDQDLAIILIQTALIAIALAVGLGLFFLPSILAYRRQHRNFWPIFFSNLVGGIVLGPLGWLGVMMWAIAKVPEISEAQRTVVLKHTGDVALKFKPTDETPRG